MRQVVNGITSTYMLDLNAGLTHSSRDDPPGRLYLYGNGRIAQSTGRPRPTYWAMRWRACGSWRMRAAQ